MRDHRGLFLVLVEGTLNIQHRTFNVEYLATVCKRVFSLRCGEVKHCYNHSMSRKQEIYRELLMIALPLLRNTLSDFHDPREERFLSLEDQRDLRSSYEIAQLVHELHVSILDEEFVEHDVWFLNSQARSVIEENSDQTCACYSTLAYYIQELFKIVPSELRSGLTWNGPEGDYEWARPKSGSE